MTRAIYDSREIDPNHQIIEGIRSALVASHKGRAITNTKAIDSMDVYEDGTPSSIDDKIAQICKELDCAHERIGDEVVFRM
jgi:hypothetical protein